jgi:spore coat polysaccharide biosynthesis predicted glycosyltransferase SpsG
MIQKKKKMILRCSGSFELGLGHLSRCSAIARNLPGIDCTLVINPYPAAEEFIKTGEVDYLLLPESLSEREEAGELVNIACKSGANLVLLDNKDHSRAYLEVLKQAGLLVVDIEDRGDGRQLADILLDSHVWPEDDDYACEGPSFCGFGPEWVLMDPAYALLRLSRLSVKKSEKTSDVLEIVISCGGSDPAGLSPRVMEVLAGREEFLRITAVMGPGAKETALSCGSHELRLVRGTHSLARILCRSDLAVVSGGITMCECMCLGIPTVFVPQHREQFANARRLADRGGILLAELPDNEGFYSSLEELIDKLLTDRETRTELSGAGSEIVDGQGISRLEKQIKMIIK